jgi:hypothetical protein
MAGEKIIGKDLEESSCGLINQLYWPNMSLEHYQYTGLLNGK